MVKIVWTEQAYEDLKQYSDISGVILKDMLGCLLKKFSVR